MGIRQAALMYWLRHNAAILSSCHALPSCAGGGGAAARGAGGSAPGGQLRSAVSCLGLVHALCTVGMAFSRWAATQCAELGWMPSQPTAKALPPRPGCLDSVLAGSDAAR